ncbi:MAG: DUF6036 family nucleotidyltransferase [Nanoarchaeota archaeon]|nr:hypothetical protein [Nanoarchaeota archaeon]MBU1031194.1 hypothetical protein [Nanoarchaeota archaeon]MBU1850344.1 hypothetical protein [Nanoarchaeota archaeon]
MITNYDQIEEFFKEINQIIEKKINLYVIGGAVLLRRDLKGGTKDIDLVVDSKAEFMEFQKALEKLDFKPQIPGKEYEHMNLNQIFQKEDFRIDVFYKEVCGKFSLTEDMKQRAEIIQDLENLRVSHCSNEDILLFKTMTERDGDLDDCISIAVPGIDWKIILKELQNQIKQSKQDVWITWVGERLDLLEDKGLEIPIMNEFDSLRNKYFEDLEKKQSQN